jgi:diaminopimelate decarboxylase
MTFPRHSRVLHAGRHPVPELALRYGTPLYVYDAQVVRERCARVRGALSGLGADLHYSVKACSNLAILRLLHAEGCGFDVVSAGEIERCLQCGIPAGRIGFAGVGKTPAEIALAVERGVGLVHVENEAEIEILAREAAQQGRRVALALRLNPDVDPCTHPGITTGTHRNKFGLTREAARAVAARLDPRWLTLRGVHVHIGSQVRSVEPYRRATAAALELWALLRAAGHPLEVLDLGGGFAVAGEEGPALDLDELAAALRPLLAEHRLQLLVEPGRFLVADAAILVTRVLYVKEAAQRALVICDAGMNDFLRPALYGALHPVVAVEEAREAAPGAVDLVGPICEPRPGDLLAVLQAGAYGFSMSSNYNTRPRPAEVLVDGAAVQCIRRRETLEDLWGPELSCG